MKYFTKEWYDTVQRSMILYEKSIVDKDCYEDDIARLYQAQLDEHLKIECKFAESRNTVFNEKAARTAYGKIFEKKRIPHAKEFFPKWVVDAVDARLLALGYIPKSIFARLKEEIDEELKISEQGIAEGRKILESQDIPDEINDSFHFHDAFVVAARKIGRNYHLYVENTGYEDYPAYIKITFKNTFFVEREKSLRIMREQDEEGYITSNCRYLYDEIYRTDKGYEFHFMFWTLSSLRYLTVGCEDVEFDGVFDIEEIWNNK